MDGGKPTRSIVQRTGQHDTDHTSVAMPSNGTEKQIDRAVTMKTRGIVYDLDEASCRQGQVLRGLTDVDAPRLEAFSFVGDQDRVSTAFGENRL